MLIGAKWRGLMSTHSEMTQWDYRLARTITIPVTFTAEMAVFVAEMATPEEAKYEEGTVPQADGAKDPGR
jgi:hypothetical protein